MRSMFFESRARQRLAALVLSLALAGTTVGLAACGEDDGDLAQGGEITIAIASQPDALDPALTYTVSGIEPLWLVYTPLLTYRHEEGEAGSELIPGLAEDLPDVSEDGRTYVLRLRDDLRYSDGTPAKASDFEHAVKRALNLESGGSFYYEFIEGASEYLDAGEPEADISGIETDDSTGEIRIQLTAPYAAFSNVLALWFGGLVPSDTPFENLTEDPPPGIGPYMVTESEPNRQFVLEKNPEFESLEIPDIPAGNIDKITTRVVKNLSQQTQDVLDNELDYMQDPPPADLKPLVLEAADARYEEYPTLSTYYFFLNHRTPPFDDPRVRAAVNFGIDKPTLARIYAGELALGCSFLPPGMPGYSESVDVSDCPYGDPTQAPDVERARELIEEAGAEGAEVTVWGDSEHTSSRVTQAYTDMLNEIGLDAEPRILDGGVYFQTIGNQETEAQTGFTNWFMDFPHPLNMFFLLDPDAIQQTNNENVGNVEDPEVKRELDRLEQEPDVEAVAEDWAALDEYVTAPEQAHVAVFGHRSVATFFSDRMDFDSAVFHPVYANDYSTWALKEGEQ